MFIVRFTRLATEDLDTARENFPHLEFNPTVQLLEQFKMELCENRRLRGLWTILRHYDNYDDQPRQGGQGEGHAGVLYVWVHFEWKSTIMAFVKEVQRTFDECGMNGSFCLSDGVASNGTTYSRDDLGRATLAEKVRLKISNSGHSPSG